MKWLAILIGGFYVFAGVFLMRQLAMNRLLDDALSRITLADPDPKEQWQDRLMTIGGVLTFAGGLAVLTLSRYALALFTLSVLWQGGYLVWAQRALPPQDSQEAKGRRSTIVAFTVYVAAWLFVVWASLAGAFRPWALPLQPITLAVVEPGMIALATALVAFRTLRIRVGKDIQETDDGPRTGFALRIAPEYQCWPLWDADTGENLSPEEAGLPPELAERVHRWDEALQATYRSDDPLSSGFASEEEERTYIQEGQALVEEIRRVHSGSVTTRLDLPEGGTMREHEPL